MRAQMGGVLLSQIRVAGWVTGKSPMGRHLQQLGSPAWWSLNCLPVP